MGALLLFSNQLRIIDTALLCNKILAKNGYKIFNDYIFNIEKPDVIETHGILDQSYKDLRIK